VRIKPVVHRVTWCCHIHLKLNGTCDVMMLNNEVFVMLSCHEIVPVGVLDLYQRSNEMLCPPSV
jgi:hypothetical protein